MLRRWRILSALGGLLLVACLPVRSQVETTESRVLRSIRERLQPGQPLLITELYEKVFTRDEERRVLNKLYAAFFRIPLFLVEYQEWFHRHPTLKEIAAQFPTSSMA